MSRKNPYPVPTGGETHDRNRRIGYGIGFIATGSLTTFCGAEAVQSFLDKDISGVLWTVGAFAAGWAAAACVYNLTYPRLPAPRQPHH